jgi:hypothetical protein
LCLAPLLRGKYESGRTFAGRRIRNAGAATRIRFAAGAPILPMVLLGRKLGAAVASRQRDRLVSFFAAGPLLAFCLAAWSAGEFAGYITGRAFPRDIPVGPMAVAA